MATILTPEDIRLLETLCTRDEDGRHFTAIYPAEWLATMEAAGYIRIERPVHAPTGIAYASEYWKVDLTNAGQEAVDTAEAEDSHAMTKLDRIAAAHLVLCRSDMGDGGWSLHPAGSSDEDIAEGIAPVLADGTATMVDDEWDAPTEADYRVALAAARQLARD